MLKINTILALCTTLLLSSSCAHALGGKRFPPPAVDETCVIDSYNDSCNCTKDGSDIRYEPIEYCDGFISVRASTYGIIWVWINDRSEMVCRKN